MTHSSLAHLDRAKAEIALAEDVEEVKDLRDKAEALRIYQKQAGAGLEIQNRCAEIKIRAERRAGELLAEVPRSTAGRRVKNSTHAGGNFATTLKEHGIPPTTAERWQEIASIDEDTFEAEIAKTKGEKKELTSSQMVRKAKSVRRSKEKTSVKTAFSDNRETQVVDDIVAQLQSIAIVIRSDLSSWTEGNQERVNEALVDVVAAFKGE